VSGLYLPGMNQVTIQNFQATIRDVPFEFITMNGVRLQLYQVYVLYNGQKVRFHMQIREDGNFYITDKHACPAEYHELEGAFSEAILANGLKA
jgi:hypothetical protein